MKRVADTGFLVAFLNDGDQYSEWAKAEAARFDPPWHTCEAVIAEAAYFTGQPALLAELVQRRFLIVDFALTKEAAAVAGLCRKYSGRMDLADACVVRLSELYRNCQVWTVDKKDFTVYRRYGNREIPCVFPPDG